MKPRLAGRVAIITGAGSGIGRSTALLFSDEGAKVIVSDIMAEGGNTTVDLIKARGGEATFVRSDVSKAIDAKNLVDQALMHYGRLDILFNNAGINLEKTVLETSEEEFDRVIDVNLKGVFLCSKYAIPELVKSGKGIIINTASMVAIRGQYHLAAYCASKGGVIALTKAMAKDLERHNIRVNSICPSGVLTPMHEAFLATLSPTEREAQEKRANKLAKPEEIASIALFLASDESSFVSGVALPVDRAN